ncbi:MAG: hypothetical protein FWF02_14465 [Micrococcales bacterium]|nr:hypothetical protein [Micrococcales bacterium]MCL2668881.1 hypothetical protein [Micrococcales bacterium]
MGTSKLPVPEGAVDKKYLKLVATRVEAGEPSGPEGPGAVADLLLSLTDEQRTAFLEWSETGLQERIDQRALIDQGPCTRRWGPRGSRYDWGLLNLTGLQSAIRFWHEPTVTSCVRMLRRQPAADFCGVAPQLLVAKMVRHGPRWATSFINGILRPRRYDVPVGAVVSVIRHFELLLPEGDRFAQVWAELLANLANTRGTNRTPLWWHVETAGWVSGAALAQPNAKYGAWGPGTQAGVFSSTPHLEQLVCQVIGLPDALHTLHHMESEQVTFSGLVGDAVAAGQIARQPVLAAVVDALDSTSYRPTAQRVLVNLLKALELTAADVSAIAPRMISILSVAPATAVSVLWDRLATIDLEPDDLLELGTVLLSRKEKKLWGPVVAYLVKLPETSPLASTAVALCTQAASLDDRVVAARASTFVGKHTPCTAAPASVDAEPTGLWAPAAPVPWREPWGSGLNPNEKNSRAVGLHAPQANDPFRAPSYDDGAQVFVRIGVGTNVVCRGLFLAALDGLDHEWRGPRTQLGQACGVLLCVPTWSDGTLSFDDLLDRVKAAQDEGYWPHDLAQALLRLEPTDPRRAAELDGLSLKPAANADLPDAVPLIRAWVAAGGIVIPEATFDDLGDTVLPDLRLPVLVPTVPAMCALTGNGATRDPGDQLLGTVPLAVEYLCSFGRATHPPTPSEPPPTFFPPLGWKRDRWYGKGDVGGSVPGATQRFHSGIAKAHGPFGRATYGHLAMNFTQPPSWLDEFDRGLRNWVPQDVLWRDIVDLIAQDRFDAQAFVEALRYISALPSHVHSGFSWVRFAARCDEIAQAGALHGIWPVVTAMAVTAVTSAKPPTGTLDVLRLGTRYVRDAVAHVPPDEAVPPEVRQFAASKGKTKTVLEARAWLDTATAAGATFSHDVAPTIGAPAVSFDTLWPPWAGTAPAVVDAATLTAGWELVNQSERTMVLWFDIVLPDQPDTRFRVTCHIWAYDLLDVGECKAYLPDRRPVWLHWDAATGCLLADDVASRGRNGVRPGTPYVLSTTLVALALALTACGSPTDRRDGEDLVTRLITNDKISAAGVRVAMGQLLACPEVDPARLVRVIAKPSGLIPTLWPLLTEPVRVAGSADGPAPRWLSRVLDTALVHAPTLREAAARGLLPADAATWPGLSDLAARPGKAAATTKARTLLEALGLTPSPVPHGVG